MKIPSSFQIAGITWTVLDDPLLRTEYGYCNQAETTIVLNSNKHISKQMREQTFIHELTHAILFGMGKTEHDEVFVDGFSAFLHQYLTTAK